MDNTHTAASLSGSGSSQMQTAGLPRRVAVVHDWLDKVGGAERVLEQILHCFPEADLFALVDALSDADRSIVFGKNVHTTFIQKLPGARRFFRLYLPLMPLAIEQLDLTAYDLIISSSWAFAKGVITGPEQLHVAYVHTPIRYAWDQQHRYLRQMGSSLGLRRGIVRMALHWVRLWDLRTVAGVDIWVANSSNVSQRIRKTYRQNAIVVYPPVSTDDFPLRLGHLRKTASSCRAAGILPLASTARWTTAVDVTVSMAAFTAKMRPSISGPTTRWPKTRFLIESKRKSSALPMACSKRLPQLRIG